MSALQKLQQKIQQWKEEHEELKRVNETLKRELEGASETAKVQEGLKAELEASQSRCQNCEEELAALKRELQEKDAEIEKIITQVEALLSA